MFTTAKINSYFLIFCAQLVELIIRKTVMFIFQIKKQNRNEHLREHTALPSAAGLEHQKIAV